MAASLRLTTLAEAGKKHRYEVVWFCNELLGEQTVAGGEMYAEHVKALEEDQITLYTTMVIRGVRNPTSIVYYSRPPVKSLCVSL